MAASNQTEGSVSQIRRKAVRDLSRRRSIERGLSSFAALVVVPGACAALGAFTPDIHKDYGTAMVVGLWITLVVLLGIFAVRLNPTGESLLSLVVENEEMEDRIQALSVNEEKLGAVIDRLALEASYSISVRAAIITLGRRGVHDLEALQRAIDDLAVPIYLQGEAVFGFGPNEAWSFAVYLYSRKQDLLTPVWRQKSAAHSSPPGSLGRAWNRGEGHVGKTFVDQRTIITGNASSPEAEPLSAVPPAKQREYDRATYVSFAAVPIGPVLSEDPRPYGVIVATSDRVGRFSRDNAGILVQVAGAIASLLIVGDLDIDNMISAEDGAGGGNCEQAIQ